MHNYIYSAMVLFASGLQVIAASPDVQALFPSGGQRGQTVNVSVVGKVNPWPVQFWCSSSKITFQAEKKSGQFKVTIPDDTLPGIHWIRLANADGSSTLRPFYVGTLPEIKEIEPNNDYRSIKPWESTTKTINGSLNPRGDVDCFAISMKKDETLVASLLANEKLLSPMDSILQILDQQGFVLKQNHDFHGLDPQLTFRAPETATYIVRLFCFPSVPNSTIGHAGGTNYVYRLTLTTGPFIEQAYPLAVSRTDPGNVQTIGWNLSKEMHTIRPSLNQETLFHPKAAGWAPLQWESHPTFTEETALKEKPFTGPRTITGIINKSGENDVYPMRVEKGQKWTLQLDGPAIGSPIDPLLTITDKTGKEILRADDVGSRRTGPRDAFTTWTVRESGIYQLQVSDLFNHSGPLYLYRLRITQAKPEFALSVKADSFTVKAKGSLDIPITITRTNGFIDPIQIVAEGLPSDVKVNAVTSEPKGATAKSVKLKIQTGSKLLTVPFQISGKVMGKKLETIYAEASITGSTIKLPDLWLTVTK